MGGALNIGIIGVGTISAQYFAEFPKLEGVKVVAVADVNAPRAAEVAAEHDVEALSVDALLADPRIDAVLNLTIPAAHVDIATRALLAGKHVYGEKPLAHRDAALAVAGGAGACRRPRLGAGAAARVAGCGDFDGQGRRFARKRLFERHLEIVAQILPAHRAAAPALLPTAAHELAENILENV